MARTDSKRLVGVRQLWVTLIVAGLLATVVSAASFTPQAAAASQYPEPIMPIRSTKGLQLGCAHLSPGSHCGGGYHDWEAVDIMADPSTTVVSPVSGQIVDYHFECPDGVEGCTSTPLTGMGNYIVIRETATGNYWHLMHLKRWGRIFEFENDGKPNTKPWVVAGQELALSGSSDTRSPHLHVDVRSSRGSGDEGKLVLPPLAACDKGAWKSYPSEWDKTAGTSYGNDWTGVEGHVRWFRSDDSCDGSAGSTPTPPPPPSAPTVSLGRAAQGNVQPLIWSQDSGPDVPGRVMGNSTKLFVWRWRTTTPNWGNGVQEGVTYLSCRFYAGATQDNAVVVQNTSAGPKVFYRTGMLSGSTKSFLFGPGDSSSARYLCGDFLGLGYDQIAVLMSNGQLHVRRSVSDKTVTVIGVAGLASGDVPMAANWGGVSQDGIVVARPTADNWWAFTFLTANGMPARNTINFGRPTGSVPAMGDMDNHEDDDPVIYYPDSNSFRAIWPDKVYSARWF